LATDGIAVLRKSLITVFWARALAVFVGVLGSEVHACKEEWLCGPCLHLVTGNALEAIPPGDFAPLLARGHLSVKVRQYASDGTQD